MKSIETYYLNKIVKTLQEGYNHALLKEAVPYSLVNEEVFNLSSLDDDAKDRIFSIFKDSYEKSLGTSWSKDKFLSRANNWEFYGTEKGFVAVRPQKSGLYKLVGVAGNTRDVLKGLNELESKNIPIWGMVSSDIKSMAEKKGFKTPSKLMLKMIYKFIPKSVFGGVDTEINKDGSITLKYLDVGDSKKYFIGNDKYFEKVKKDIMPSFKNKLKLFEDITAGRMVVYHRTKTSEDTIKGISADGWRIGHGAYYGPGVYTNYKFEGTQTDYSRHYGDMIIESRVLNLKDFLILDKEPAKKVYGNDYLVQSQLKKILKGKWNKYKNTEQVKLLINRMKFWPEKPGQIYKDFYDSSEEIVSYFRGVVYNGNNDAYTCIIYDRNNIEPLRYSLDDGETWTLINDKNIIKRIKSGKFKTKYLPIVHFRNKVKLGRFSDINLDYIKKIPKNELEFFVDEISKSTNNIDTDIYDFLSKDLKQLYIEKRIKAVLYLEDYEYKDAPDNLKQLYIEKRIEVGSGLTNTQYKASPDNIKKFYIEKIVEAGLKLEEYVYKDAPDNLKQLYIEKRVKAVLYLEDYEYKDASDNLKQLYIEKVVEVGFYLPDSQYDATPNNLKQLYIEKLVKAGLYLSNPPYKDASDNLKKLYIEKITKSGYYLTNPQYEATPDNLKQLYIEKRVKAGLYLTDPQYKYTPDNLKKYYFKLVKDNDIKIPTSYDYYNDYQEYLKNNP